MSVSWQFLIALTLLLTLIGCAQTPQIKEQPSGEFATEGLHKVSASGFREAYARPGAGLSEYRILSIEALDVAGVEIPQTAVAGTLRRDWQMTPERESALQTRWADAMAQAFEDYSLADSGDRVLRITAQMTRVAPGRPSATTIGAGVQPMRALQDVVEVFMEFRLYDQASGELLAVLRDSRTMIGQAMSRTAPVGIQTMFGSWAALLHTRVSGR
jgi:hypothetical protein